MNTGTNLPAQRDLYAVNGNEYKFLFVAKGGGSANKTYLYQETKALLTPEKLEPFLIEKMKSLGTAACPPYHIAFAIGGTSATSPPNTTDVNYSAGVGVGAAATGASGNDGGNGYIVLQWGGITTLDLDSIECKEVLVIKENGTETTVPFVATSSDLFPKHPSTSGSTEGNRVRSMALITLDFDNVEQQRIVDACRLLYGDEDLAQISEIAFCYGVDKPVAKEYPTEGAQNPKVVSNGRLEAVAVTVAIHYTLTPVAVTAAKKKLGGAWDIGIGEPLYGSKLIK